ncbi:MAG: fatty acid desaturase, partial [Candidatus Thiodiazotropha sp. (ex Lucinoma borealis)]|nr:fatty acid desaturase [Candidatus Thiodiazotropha sp. (ex Lucinoma borealis)]
MNKLMVNLRYFLTPALIVTSLIGIVIGGPWVWLGVAMFGASIALDWVTSILPTHAKPAGTDEEGELNGIPWLLNTMMYMQFPVFVTLQLSLVWRVYEYTTGVPIGSTEILGAMEFAGLAIPAISIQTGITGVELIGAAISAAL